MNWSAPVEIKPHNLELLRVKGSKPSELQRTQGVIKPVMISQHSCRRCQEAGVLDPSRWGLLPWRETEEHSEGFPHLRASYITGLANNITGLNNTRISYRHGTDEGIAGGSSFLDASLALIGPRIQTKRHPRMTHHHWPRLERR